jgi:ATP-dependent Clp endopeptidase proteolytic subunit ClpP
MDTSNRSPQIFEALLTKRQILLQGEVDGDIQQKITRWILYLNALNDTPITLFIDSFGGSTELSLCICDAVVQSQAQVIGVVVADASSAGFRILQSCQRRLSYPRARLMFHAPSIANKRIDSDDWAEDYKKIQEMHEEQLNVYAKRSKQPIKRLREWSKEEKRFTADEAFKAGFLDEVIKPPRK